MMTHIASYANMYIITIKDFYMLQMPDVFSQQLSSIISMQVLHNKKGSHALTLYIRTE